MEQREDKCGLFEFLTAIPDFEERGKEYTGKCPNGGTVHAKRSTYNGHIHAWCDKCGMRIIE